MRSAFILCFFFLVQNVFSQDKDGNLIQSQRPSPLIRKGENHKWAYAEYRNKELVNLTEYIYDDAREFHDNGVALVLYNGKYAIINRAFEFASAFYDEMSIYTEEDLFFVKKGSLYGFINAEGKEIIPVLYPSIHYSVLDKKYVSVSNGTHWALFDTKGVKIIDFEFTCPLIVRDGFISTCNDNGLFGCMDLRKRSVIPFNYQSVEILKHNTFLVSLEGNPLLLNTWNKKLFSCHDCTFSETLYLSHLVVKKNNKVGLSISVRAFWIYCI